MRVVCKRTVLNTLRNPQTSYAQLALNIFFALLVGLIYYQIPMTLPEALENRYCMQNIPLDLLNERRNGAGGKANVTIRKDCMDS